MFKRKVTIFLCGILFIACILFLNNYINAKAYSSYWGEENDNSEQEKTIQVGDNVYAEVNDTGILTISGSGDMWKNTYTDESVNNVNSLKKWDSWLEQWRDDISDIVIKEGVTSTGDYVFSNMELMSVEISGTVRKIESNIFKNSVVYSVILNNGTKIVKNNAFGSVEATIYSKDMAVMDGAFANDSRFLCYKDSKPDKYAKTHAINVEFLADDGEEEDISGKTDSQILDEFISNRNDDWQSVYYIDHKTKKLYYVNYGKLSIARNLNEIYVKKGSVEQRETTHQAETVYGKIFGTTLTNGKDIIYQSGRDIYLWKNVERKVKIVTFAKYSYILTAMYGNEIYFQKDMSNGGNEPQKYSLYKYNLKTKKVTNMKIDNVYYSNGRYLIFAGKYDEKGSKASAYIKEFYTLNVYDIEFDNAFLLSERACGGWSVVIDGQYIYYTLAEPTECIFFEPEEYEYRTNIVRYNIKSGNKKTIKKKIEENVQCFIDKNRFVCDGSKKDYLYDIQENSKSVI